MFKIIWSITFLALTSYAFWIYINRDIRSIKQNLEDIDQAGPRIQVENFVIYRYDGDTLDSRIEANLGRFVEPNSMEIFGDFRGYRYGKLQTETVKAETIEVMFAAENLGDMLEGSDLERVLMSNDVRLNTSKHQLLTDSSLYEVEGNVVTGERPVLVTGPGRWFRGRSGFRLNLDTKELNLYGKINGETNTLSK